MKTYWVQSLNRYAWSGYTSNTRSVAFVQCPVCGRPAAVPMTTVDNGWACEPAAPDEILKHAVYEARRGRGDHLPD